MSITQEKAVRLVEITRRKADELFSELIVELEAGGVVESVDADANIAADDRDLAARPSGYDEPWSFDEITLPPGGWLELGKIEEETYGWPDGSVDTYRPFVSYTGTGGLTGATLALGYKENGEVIGFVLGAGGGSKRGLTVFWATNDIATSHEKISMIRGGGATGRAGFRSNDSLPDAYQGFKVEMLRDRVAGKWNVQSVVAKADDHETMLNHTFLQARLRRLV